MSDADDLIERAERETRQRIDDGDASENNAIALILGALAREMGVSGQRDPRTDFAAGFLIQQDLAHPEVRKRKEENDDFLCSMLSSGFSPDELKHILG